MVKATKITDEFDYDAFRNLYGPTAIVLMVIEETGELTLCAVDRPITPRPGQTLISLVEVP